MNYQRIYEALIARARLDIPAGYSEVHHVVPRCLGGSDDLSNLVALTARQHFVAHQLLAKIHGGKLAVCAWRMSNMNQYGNRRYAWLKHRAVKIIGESNRGKKHSEEWRANIAAGLRGKKFSPERRRNIGAAGVGRIPWNKGKPMSKEQIIKLSKIRKGRKQSQEFVERRIAPLRGRKQSPEHIAKRVESIRRTKARKAA